MSDGSVLISFAREEPALLLANYLRQQGVELELVFVETQQTPYCLCLQNPEQLPFAQHLTQSFLNNPTDDKYQKAAWQDGVIAQSPSSLTANLPSLSDLARTPFTSVILLVCCLIFAGMQLGWLQQILSEFMFQPVEVLLQTNQWWRLLSPALIHFSLLHIAFNLLWWWTLGKQIESLLGVKQLLLVFLLTALLSNYAQFLVSGPNFGGLSGVVYGVMGFVWFSGWLKPGCGLSLSKPLVGFMLVWLLLGYADVLWVNMANTAHTVGLVSGCAYAWLYWRGRSIQSIPDTDT